MKITHSLSWFVFALVAISVGLYPLGYALSDVLENYGLLSQKAPEIVNSTLWTVFFYIHIYLGGLSLLIGWSLFSKRYRQRSISTHRFLDKIYIISVILGGLSGLYIAFFASGGLIAQAGFTALALVWLFTTIKAYIAIRIQNIESHRDWMIRSYAITFAAVTLRIWLPLFQFVLGMDFLSAYIVVAWLCWVPNLLWAEWKVKLAIN